MTRNKEREALADAEAANAAINMPKWPGYLLLAAAAACAYPAVTSVVPGPATDGHGARGQNPAAR